jgi:hypothetical protein
MELSGFEPLLFGRFAGEITTAGAAGRPGDHAQLGICECPDVSGPSVQGRRHKGADTAASKPAPLWAAAALDQSRRSDVTPSEGACPAGFHTASPS